MINIEWFTKRMKHTFQTTVIPSDVSYEVFDFYHEEIDDLLIPKEHLEKLPNPINLLTFSYVDEFGYEWTAGIVENENTKEILYEVWIKMEKR